MMTNLEKVFPRKSWLLPRTKGFYLAAEGDSLGLGTIDNRALMLQVETVGITSEQHSIQSGFL